ncbi:hypothetical protein GB928_011110 [Shinella curvata]|uniref:Uncharacterized protein n=1 Tax=Shinella curvata TaxID=1817964 RepID=A0ABT8XES3_9HYPH|nr:hypothetical protein [Shinella curvata]MCJ8055314.1 hypothetical protein [Shinella curvata]MDO6121731.1 hypothetical protein [Shinella curvata]
MSEIRDVLRDHLIDHRTRWSMGSFGAIAEFHQDKGEFLEVDALAMFARATPRGAIRLHVETIGQSIPVAYETLSPKPHRWGHGLALCLPQNHAGMAGRKTLTELGPDEHAVRPGDRGGVLFDIGLDLPQCDFCIRTRDPDLLAVLRANTGRSLFDPGNPVGAAIIATHPHRVALTRIGRIEVFQKIGGPDTGGVSPRGPHSHLLPHLLKSRHIHSANIPVPRHHIPVGYFHPANPVLDSTGRDLEFDIDAHARFQELFERFARRDLPTLRAAVLDGLARKIEPEQFLAHSDRFSRATVRITLRQQYRLAKRFGGGSYLDLIAKWCDVLDRCSDTSMAEDDAPGYRASEWGASAIPLVATG